MHLSKILLVLGAAGVSVAALFGSTLQLLEGHNAIEVVVATVFALGVGATFASQYFQGSRRG
jgi:hypothetical protein